MKYFKEMELNKVEKTEKWGHKEVKTADFMRKFITATTLIAFILSWVLTGEIVWPFLWILLIIGFYWFWYQWLPRFEKRWEFEDLQKELNFVRLLYKYIDAAALEKELDNHKKKLNDLEKKLSCIEQ